MLARIDFNVGGQAQLYRTKAHILRMASANDVAIAHHDLNDVEKLDAELQVRN